MRSRPLIAALGIMLILAAWAVAPHAQSWDQAIAWVLERQRLFHRDLAAQLRQMAAGSSAAAWALASVSFLYGVFHAAGPGHGKAVIATYLVTHESKLVRGVWLAAASSLCQGLVAILVVYGLILVAGWLPRETQEAVAWSERLSFALLILMGALLALRAAVMLAASFRQPKLRPIAAHRHDQGCGCDHGPTARQLNEAHGLRATLGIILSIGLRPCSGAVLVLVFAHILGLAWAGIGAVIAMSTGTAITVGVLAVMVVKAKHWTIRLFAGNACHRHRVAALAGLAGGIVIVLFGASLLLGSFGPAHPLRI